MSESETIPLLRVQAERFFRHLIAVPDARRHLAAYDGVLHLRTPRETVLVELRGGDLRQVRAGSESVGYWDLELEADAAIFQRIFQGAMSPGAAMWEGRLFMPEEKAKHNLVVATFQAIRVAQEHLPRCLGRCVES